MKLLSNIVREKDEDTFRSKNVLATNGTITSTLKRHWQLNDVWNEIVSPRFKRLNELTNSNFFGDYREINGHKVFINTVPEEANKNFDPKRIDHRHHALDALIIALTTENHVNYLNNISAQQENDEDKLKTRKGYKFQLTNSRKGFNDEKEWYFLPPAQIKTKDGIDEFEYQFGEAKSKLFKEIAQNAIENTITSFKQKNRVIRQRWNKYLKPIDGKVKIVTQEGLKEVSNYNVRKRLHEDTFYGKVKLQNKIITISLEKALIEKFDLVDAAISKEIKNLTQTKGKSIQEIIETLKTKYPKVHAYEKFVATRFGNELESFASIPSDKIVKKIQSITDTGIQKILENHLEKYKEVIAGKTKFDTENAFSSDGIKELNKNIIELNNGKFHHPIYKVRTSDAKGTKFSVSEEGQKSTKYVVTAAGSNAFCGFYQKGSDRKYYIPTLRESVESLKQGFEPCPASHPENPEYKLIFVLNPSDLVYVPTEEEIENPKLVDFSRMKKDQVNRIYKFTDGSGIDMNFIPVNIATVLFNLNKEKQKKAGIDLPIQNEVGVGSQGSKNQNTLDGIQIKSVCWKLKVDRLGNISKV